MSNLLMNFGAMITLGFGIWAIFKPNSMVKLISLTPYNNRGVTEIRAVYGGWTAGLAAFTLFNQSAILFDCLGFGWLLAALVRLVSMFFVDKSYSKVNRNTLFVELCVGVLLLM